MTSDPGLLELATESANTARYPGLSEEELEEARELEFTEKQMTARNLQGLKKMTEKLEKYTLKIIDGPVESWQGKELRLALLGSTGVGKSALGNLVIGRKDCFKESHGSNSCTPTVERESATIDGVTIQVMDTPGLNDTGRSVGDILTEVAKVFDEFSDGIHGFLFVYNGRNCRFTKEQQSAFQEMEKLFGTTFLDSCYFVISHGDGIADNCSLEAYLDEEKHAKDGPSIFWKLVKKLNDRVILAEGKNTKYLRQLQREQIVRLICRTSKKAYMHGDFEKHKQQIRDKVKKGVRLTPDMEKEFLQYLKKESHVELLNLGGKGSSEMAEKFYRQNKQEMRKKFDDHVLRMMPRIEREVSNHLQSMTHGKLLDLKGKQFDRVAEEIFQKVKSETKEWIPDMVLREAVQILLYGGKERLINPTFLERLKSFVKPLLVLVK